MADLALLVLTILWGTTFHFVKRVLEVASPGVFLAARFGVAALVLAVAWLASRERPGARFLRHGLVLGQSRWLRAMTAHPLRRALECGKLTIAALEATLRLYRQSAYLPHVLPALRALTRPLADVEDTARRALPALASALGVGFRVSVMDSSSRIGEDAFGGIAIPTKVLVVEHDYMGPTRIASRFRQARPPIIGRVEGDWFVLDARTVFDALELVPNWTDELEGPVTPGP